MQMKILCVPFFVNWKHLELKKGHHQRLLKKSYMDPMSLSKMLSPKCPALFPFQPDQLRDRSHRYQNWRTGWQNYYY